MVHAGAGFPDFFKSVWDLAIDNRTLLMPLLHHGHRIDLVRARGLLPGAPRALYYSNTDVGAILRKLMRLSAARVLEV